MNTICNLQHVVAYPRKIIGMYHIVILSIASTCVNAQEKLTGWWDWMVHAVCTHRKLKCRMQVILPTDLSLLHPASPLPHLVSCSGRGRGTQREFGIDTLLTLHTSCIWVDTYLPRITDDWRRAKGESISSEQVQATRDWRFPSVPSLWAKVVSGTNRASCYVFGPQDIAPRFPSLASQFLLEYLPILMNSGNSCTLKQLILCLNPIHAGPRIAS